MGSAVTSPDASAGAAPPQPAAGTAAAATNADGAGPRAPVADYASAEPVSGKTVGHTSVVFKLKLAGGLEAAFKPRSHRGHDRYRGEIAAYRLATALGLDNVPAAVPRAFSLKSLQTALQSASAARELLDREVVADPDGQVPGALIPWIPKLELLALESDEWRGRWTGWLASDAGPPSDLQASGADASGADAPFPSPPELAGQVSTMIVFDYLTGNWDRWSGGQIGIARATGTVLFLDNDGAFYDPPPPGPLASQLGRLTRVWHFSRGFIDRLRSFDPDAARAAIGDDGRGKPLLPPSVLKGLEERRKRALAIVDEKVAERSPVRVLSFP